MRHDRTGDVIDEDATDSYHRCYSGWLGPDEDHPRPCPTCRPHLVRQRTNSSSTNTSTEDPR